MSRPKATPVTLDSRNEWNRSAQAQLWRCVLQRAIIDAFTPPGKNGATDRETAEAQRWLAGGGRDLRLACECAGIDAGMVSAWAQEMGREGWPRHRYEVYRQIVRGMENDRVAA